MSNLATMIMEGSNYGGFKAHLTHSYDHEDGAALIAMESAEALRDIFEAEFYVPNTCTIKATLEGASCVEESSQVAIMEASVKGAFAKIKEFFIKLKDKVLEFLHNIKRYLTGIFGNDEKWVKNYEKELNGIKSDLKDYEIKMYTYTIDKVLSKDELSKMIEEGKSATEKTIEGIIASSKGTKDEIDTSDLDEEYDNIYLDLIKEMVGKSIDADELDKALWSMMRNGADDESDKEDVKVASNMAEFISALKSSKKDLSAFDTMISKTNTMYTKCIKLIDDSEKKLGKIKEDENGNHYVKLTGKANYTDGYGKTHDNTKDMQVNLTSTQMSNATTVLRKYSSTVSKMQNAENKKNTMAKAALAERNSAYKKALTGAFAYARKNKKK